MKLKDRIINFFAKDAAARAKFINEFNANATMYFQSLMVDTLLEATICKGSDDETFRHELSAPKFVSGIVIQARAGANISVDDILLIGNIILSDQTLVRKMFVLHWDTLYIEDMRTERYLCWRIRDFLFFGGLLNQRG